MHRFIRLPLAGAACLLVFGCQSDSVSPPQDGPMYAVSDGAHNGNPDFFFLPPLFKNPNGDPNYEPAGSNPNLKPAVEICELGPPAADLSRQCIAGPPLKRFNPSAITYSDEQYQVNWRTDETPLNVAKFYRINVLVGTALLGFADVDPVSSGKDLKNVQTNEYIPLLDGRTLPIKFRIENGALCAVDGTPCGSETIHLASGGGIELVGGGEDFKFDIPSGTTATFGGQAVTDVTFNLEVCSGIDVDLPKVGACLRVSTFFDAPGGTGELVFSNPILISLCVLNSEIYTPGNETRQQELLTLHQQDGAVIRALPHASPNCNTIGMSFWDRVKNLAARVLEPRAAIAATRSAVLHVGGGGETDRTGATCTTSGTPSIRRGLFMAGVCPPSSPTRSGPQRSSMAAITPPHTVSDFQFALPAMMDFVDPDDASRSAPPGTSLPTAVKVTDWDGNAVQGANVTFLVPAIEGPPIILGTATSNSDGIASISWTIAAGSNTAVATGRGIAAQNNYPNAVVKPFMPDIDADTPQEAVFLGTGRVTFLASGEEAGTLDQQNLLDGSLGGQGIGRFSDINGDPDPDGTSFDFQDAQTFTPAVTGQLRRIKVPLVNNQGATVGVTMQVVAVNTDGVPDETHVLGEVTIPASAIPTDFTGTIGNPATWATFDFSSASIGTTSGQALGFIVKSLSPVSYLYNPESTNGYANGTGFRRNRALTAAWGTFEQDFGFQTFVTVVAIP